LRCHSSLETIRAALVGNDRHEHVFALSQSLELYDVYQAKMLDCDRKLEALIAALGNKGAKPVGKLSKPRIKTKQVNTPAFDVRTALYGVLGVDLTEIHGLGPALAFKLIGECGTDLLAWPSAKHFTSWLCLAPGNKISGGKVLSSRPGDLLAVQPPCCGWRPPQWDEAKRRSEHSIAACPYEQASQRQ
jgi:transposase